LNLFLVEQHVSVLRVLFRDGSAQLSDNCVIAFVPLVVQAFHHANVVTFPALITLMNDKTVEVIYFKILYMNNIFIFLMFFALFVSFAAHFGIFFLLNFLKIKGWQALSHPIN
jgi:hypothetical protein